jgi:hypothetical protein
MKTTSVFKPSIHWNQWILPFLFLIVLIIEKQAYGTYFSAWLYGLALIFFGFLYSFRYRLWQPALILCLAGITLWHYVLSAHFETNLSMMSMLGIDLRQGSIHNPFSMLTRIVNLFIFLVTLAVFGPVAGRAFHLERSAKRLFRLASLTITSETNGYTSRPFHAGSIDCSKDDLTGFAGYLAGKNIASPVFTDSGIFLTFSMGRSPLSVDNPMAVSNVRFDPAGNIRVNITPGDYKRFGKGSASTGCAVPSGMSSAVS